MESAHRDLDQRIDRLECDFQALDALLAPHERRDARGAAAMQSISFAVWLKISGPIFAAMLCGFTLLWEGQRALWEGQRAAQGQLIEIGRSVGRLEGSVALLADRVDGLGEAVEELSDRLDEHAGS